MRMLILLNKKDAVHDRVSRGLRCVYASGRVMLSWIAP